MDYLRVLATAPLGGIIGVCGAADLHCFYGN